MQESSGNYRQTEGEEPINEGQGIFLRRKILYHGSPNPGISVFHEAEEDTVGSGVYFTSQPKDAIGYARVRARGDGEPIVYKEVVENIKLLDLRTTEKVLKILPGFKDKLVELKAKIKKTGNEVLDQVVQDMFDGKIRAIGEGKVDIHNLRLVTKGVGKAFSEYVKSLGYEGLMTYEGGEGKEVRDHDTYLIFNSEQIQIIQ